MRRNNACGQNAEQTGIPRRRNGRTLGALLRSSHRASSIVSVRSDIALNEIHSHLEGSSGGPARRHREIKIMAAPALNAPSNSFDSELKRKARGVASASSTLVPAFMNARRIGFLAPSSREMTCWKLIQRRIDRNLHRYLFFCAGGLLAYNVFRYIDDAAASRRKSAAAAGLRVVLRDASKISALFGIDCHAYLIRRNMRPSCAGNVPLSREALSIERV